MELTRVASKRELHDRLSRCSSPKVFLGELDDDCKEFFYVFIDEEKESPLLIGICSFGIGVKPGILRSASRVFVGFNKRVVTIDIPTNKVIADADLLTLFWEFLPIQNSIVPVLCETAMVGLDMNGEVKWRVRSDLVEECVVNGDTITITGNDGSRLNIDLRTGEKRNKWRPFF